VSAPQLDHDYAIKNITSFIRDSVKRTGATEVENTLNLN